MTEVHKHNLPEEFAEIGNLRELPRIAAALERIAGEGEKPFPLEKGTAVCETEPAPAETVRVVGEVDVHYLVRRIREIAGKRDRLTSGQAAEAAIEALKQARTTALRDEFERVLDSIEIPSNWGRMFRPEADWRHGWGECLYAIRLNLAGLDNADGGA